MIPVNRHRIAQLLADAVLIGLAWYLAFQLRFDAETPPPYERLFDRTLFVVVVLKLAVFVAFGFYNRWWRYVSTRDMWALARGVTVASLVVLPAVYFWNP
ncbi:MAG: polysaccharide biosynthesis protein, partial [Gaiellaceae bacterium]